ncbi:Uncharacterized protein OBRU01_21334, partial [Operophtera brumata]
HHKGESEQDDATYLHFVEDNFPISHRDVAKETKNDLVLRKIYGYLMSAMLGRRLRSRLDMLRPRTADFVEAAQQAQVRNAGGVYREVNEGDEVLVKELRPNSTIKWKPGVITQRTGAVTYKVRTEDATKTKHIDQIMPVRKSSRLSLARSVQSAAV